MNLAQMIAKIREDIAAKLTERNAHAAELATLRSATEVDETKVAEIRAKKAAIDAELDALEAREAELKAEQARDDAAERLQREVTPTGDRRETTSAEVREPRTYRKETDRNGKAFLRDVVSAELYGNRQARERLDKHMSEELALRGEYLQERATNTGAFAGMIVPQYLTDLYAPAQANGRPFADICNHHDLPESGMVVNISRVTTASSAALQANQNDAVSETDMDDTLLSIPVQTIAGQQTISRQAIDRGAGVEDLTLKDLFKRYHTTLDNTLINQATTGLSAVAQAVTYTDASPTAAEFYPKLLQAVSQSESALLDNAMADHVVMHSRRWNWMQSQVGATWPFIAQQGIPTQSGGVNNGTGYGKGIRGTLPNGMGVVVDNNIATNLGAGTNEDEAYVVASEECHLWEDPNAPLYIRADQTKAASLGVLLVVYGYIAYTFGRYTNSQQKISGTGLVTPTF